MNKLKDWPIYKHFLFNTVFKRKDSTENFLQRVRCAQQMVVIAWKQVLTITNGYLWTERFQKRAAHSLCVFGRGLEEENTHIWCWPSRSAATDGADSLPNKTTGSVSDGRFQKEEQDCCVERIRRKTEKDGQWVILLCLILTNTYWQLNMATKTFD